MPSLNLISGPGDTTTPTQSFIQNLIAGAQLPSQLQQQKLQTQMMANQLSFNQQQQPLLLQHAQTELDNMRAQSPLQIELLKGEVAKNDQMVKYYSQATSSMEAKDEMEQQRINQAAALGSAQIAGMNVETGIKSTLLPLHVEQLKLGLEQGQADLQKTGIQNKSLSQMLDFTAQDHANQMQQFKQQQFGQALNMIGEVTKNQPGLMPALNEDPVIKTLFPQGVPAYQPTSTPEAISRMGVGMIANAPPKAQAAMVGRAAGIVTPAGLNAENMLGTTDPVLGGLESGATKIANDQKAQAAARAAFSSNASTQTKGASTTPTSTTTAPNAPDVLLDPKAAADVYGPVDNYIDTAGKFVHTPLANTGEKGQQILDKAPKSDYLLNQLEPKTSGSNAGPGAVARSPSEADKAGIPRVDQELYRWAAQNVDKTATPAQNLRWQAVIEQMYKAQAAGKDPVEAVKEFTKRYKTGALTPEQTKVIGQMADKLGT